MKKYINFDMIGGGGGLCVGENIPDHLVEKFKREWWEKYYLSNVCQKEQNKTMFIANVVLPYISSNWEALHKHLINLNPTRVSETVYPHILPII